MYKEDLAWNNLQWLTCHKIQPNQILYIEYICIKRIWHEITFNGWRAIKSNQTKSNILNLQLYRYYSPSLCRTSSSKVYNLIFDGYYATKTIKEDLAWNNLQWLTCHKIQPNQILYIEYICIKRIWHEITFNGWRAIKSNQTKSYILNIYV